jgi:uncharacterized membrane protein YkvA (DUF1232 family)
MKWIEKLKQRAKQLKSEINVLIVAYHDKRVGLWPKLLLAVTIGYLLSPVDLIPDFIPVLGLIDDLLVVPFLIRLSIKALPAEVLVDARLKVEAGSFKTGPLKWLALIVIALIWICSIWLTARLIFAR